MRAGFLARTNMLTPPVCSVQYGMLDEFKMMWELRYRFPLHYIVFKQVSSHLPHEANVEEYFSRGSRAPARSPTPTWRRRSLAS